MLKRPTCVGKRFLPHDATLASHTIRSPAPGRFTEIAGIPALPPMPDPAPKAIFLSYARDDAASARRIAEALRSIGLEVWFDENELRGGDTWDAKIRKQIDECSLFVPIISHHTESRTKGYFRLEWNLAVAQTQMLAEGVPFIAPVAIDDTRETGASVPAEFLRVQWMRLPGALPTPQFVEQVKRLLDAPKKSAASTTRAASTAPSSASARSGIPPWVWAAAVVMIGGVVTFFVTHPSTKESAPPTASAKLAAAPVSEARQLVARARALYEPWDQATRDDFFLAEELLKKATALDPADGDTWATYAILSCAFIVTSRDNSDERMAAARIQAERAIKLAPDSNAARFARAFSLRFNPQTRDECLRLLREEVSRQPTNRMVVRILGTTLSSFGQYEQALLYLDRAAALPGRDPLTLYIRGQALERLASYVEAEAAADEVLALAPLYPDAHSLKIRLLLDYHEDLAAARQHLAKFPPDFYTTDVGAVTAAMVWLYSREPMKCLEVLRPARDYIQTLTYTGPKAYLTGLAQQMAGNVDAAQTEWRAALRIVESRLAAQPNLGSLLVNKAFLVTALGERTEAESLLRVIRQRLQTGDRDISEFILARILVLMGKKEEALVALESLMKSSGPTTQIQVRNQLRYHPDWDSLHGNPRFEALLKPHASKN